MVDHSQPTEIQKETLLFIWRETLRNMYQPSYREICEHFEITKNALSDRLCSLQRKGLLEMTGESRAVRFTEKGRSFVTEHMLGDAE